MAGLFITFEGIEGCGKTTQIRILEEQLRLRGHEVVLTREPGGTPIGDKIRHMLLDAANDAMQPLTELFLYVAQRCQHVAQVTAPALEKGKIVLCDRYFDATRPYQGVARDLDPQLLGQLHTIGTGNLMPQLTLLFDCPVEVGLERANERIARSGGNRREDRFEQEHLDFHERVREAYLEIAREEPQRVRVINAADDIETVHQRV